MPIIVNRFHLVALANRAVTEYRRELAWSRRGRRGRKSDPEWGAKEPVAPHGRDSHLPEDRQAAQRDAAPTRRSATNPSDGLEKCWQGKECPSLLVRADTTPDRGVIWTRLTDFYPHCADSEIHSSAGSRGP